MAATLTGSTFPASGNTAWYGWAGDVDGTIRAMEGRSGALPAGDLMHRLISDRQVVHPQSAAMVASLQTGDRMLNVIDFGIPIYYATPTTTMRTVAVLNAPAWGRSPFQDVQVPIDASWTPSVGSDHAMVVRWADAHGVMWEAGFRNYVWSSGAATCSWGSLQVGAPATITDRGSSTGAGFSRSAGVITRDDLVRGVIDHALVFSTDVARASEFWAPAVKSDGANLRAAAVTATIPEGALLRLNPATDISALTGINKMVALALQKYGAYCIDNGSATMGFSVERPAGSSLTDAPYAAAGIDWDYFALTTVPWASMQVMIPGDDPDTGFVTLPADVTNSTVTAADVTGLAIPAGLDPGVYEVSGTLLVTSAATTTGVQLQITAASGSTPALRWSVPNTSASEFVAYDRAGAGVITATAHPYAAGAPVPAFLSGAIVVATSTSTTAQVRVQSEVASSAVTVKAGSFLRWSRVR